MNVKIKTVFGELAFNMTQDNALSLISTAAKYAGDYEGTDQRHDEIDARTYAVPALITADMLSPVNTEKEPNAPPAEKPATKSRLESLFGAKADWKMPPTASAPATEPKPTQDTESDEEPEKYQGFLYIECEKCGATKGFCIRRPIDTYKCECGHETNLRCLLPAHVKCECGSKFTYYTNIQCNEFTMDCVHCGSPVDMELGKNRTAFVTVAFSEMYKQRGTKKR